MFPWSNVEKFSNYLETGGMAKKSRGIPPGFFVARLLERLASD